MSPYDELIKFSVENPSGQWKIVVNLVISVLEEKGKDLDGSWQDIRDREEMVRQQEQKTTLLEIVSLLTNLPPKPEETPETETVESVEG